MTLDIAVLRSPEGSSVTHDRRCEPLTDLTPEPGDLMAVAHEVKHREAAVEYAINAIPTVILFKEGQIAKKWVGMVTKKDMTAEIDVVIGELAKEAEAAAAAEAEE